MNLKKVRVILPTIDLYGLHDFARGTRVGGQLGKCAHYVDDGFVSLFAFASLTVIGLLFISHTHALLFLLLFLTPIYIPY
jgi:hypothetical protein